MGIDIITEEMIALSEQLAAEFLESYRRQKPKPLPWQGVIAGRDGSGKKLRIAIAPDDGLKALTVGGHTDWGTEEYNIAINAFTPRDGDISTLLSSCLGEPEFEVSVAKAILHELTHVYDPALSDRKMWFPPYAIHYTDPKYFESPREQLAHINEFPVAIRVFNRHLTAKRLTAQQRRQNIRCRILDNKDIAYKNWMYKNERGTEYERHLDTALDNAFGI